MTIIEGIGDEIIHFCIALLIVVIGTVAWRSTNVLEPRYIGAVVLLERRRYRTHRRLTNHTHSVTITEGSSSSTTVEEQVTEEGSPGTQIPLSQPTNIEKPPEPSSEGSLLPHPENTILELQNDEQNIIETMDADSNIVRQRRLAFYGAFNNEQQDPTTSQSVFYSPDDPQPSAPPKEESIPCESKGDNINTGVTIKLKYINDDLKLVEANLSQSIGEFKRKHFLPELSANKVIRLIFNGQVLQPDTQTLKNCGLFDHCVVHCLIHQKRNQQDDPNVVESRRDGYSFPNTNTSANNNNQNRDWDLGNFLFAFISFILLAAWYFRYVYAHLYTVTATVGLILITGIFTIVLVGMYFPDNERFPPTIHVRRQVD